MDIFFLCWSFDSRWLFKKKNTCRQLIFTIPFIINISSIAWIYIQKSYSTDNHLPYFMQVIILLSLLSLSNLYMISIIRMNTSQKMTNIKNNYMAIEQFYHDYQTKKVVWSFIGLIVTICTVCLTIIQGIYIERNQGKYSCSANKFRLFIDYLSIGYILMHIILFLVVKLIYLFSAWVCCPKLYMRLKKIID